MHSVWFQVPMSKTLITAACPNLLPRSSPFHGWIHQLVVVTRTTLPVPTSALKWHNAALLQILNTCAFSLKVYLSLDWQHVTAEPSEHGASLRMVSELALGSLKSQVTAAVFFVLWLVVNLHRLVGWWWDSVVCWPQNPSSLSFYSNLTEGAKKKKKLDGRLFFQKDYFWK